MQPLETNWKNNAALGVFHRRRRFTLGGGSSTAKYVACFLFVFTDFN